MSSSGGAGTGGSGGQDDGGSGGGQNAPAHFTNTYDGGRDSTESFDADWLFHLGQVQGGQEVDFDDSGWRALDVPHDWSIELPYNENSAAESGGGYLDGGVGWYRKAFEVPSDAEGKKLYVQFDGVYMDSTVWLNGQEICARPYGYSSFECELTEHLNPAQENVLAVRVNNELPTSRWYSGSGIYRHVWLKTVDPVHVAYMGGRITTPEITASSAEIAIEMTVENDGASSASVSLETQLMDEDGQLVATAMFSPVDIEAGQEAQLKSSASIDAPHLWSTDAPYLYSAVTTVSVDGEVVDTYGTPFGIRTFAFDANTGFSLNGKNMKLNGVCLHHDLGALGAAVNTRAMEKRFELLKEMGVNAIRTSHNPPAPEFLDLTDRMGFLVMDEAFDMWYGAKTKNDYARFFREWADRDIGDMVMRDRNHPGIIIWSIGNEVPQAGDQTVAQQLIDAVREKDDTRVIGQAFAAFAYDEGTAGLEDVVGLNYHPDLYDSQHAKHPTWKFFGSETSSAFRSRGVYNSNNNQSPSYDNSWAGWGQSAEASWKDVNTRPWIAGEFIWTGVDYIGEPTPYAWPSKSSYFGAIDTADFPKDIFYFYQSHWNYDGPPMVHLVPMNWTNWSAGQMVRVLAYSNAGEVELFLNDNSLGKKSVDPSQGHLEWSVPFAQGTLRAEATKDGMVVARDEVKTAGSPAAIELAADRPSIHADGRDLVFIEMDVVDAEGVLVPQGNNKMDVTVEGPGVLVGVDNGDATDHESYKGSSISAFSGKAMAIVQSTTMPGTIVLKASSNGLMGAEVSVTTAAP